MDLRHESHQAHIFTSNADIPATPDILSLLLGKFGALGVMPTFGKAFNTKTGGMTQFVIMLSTDEKLRIEFPIDRITIATEGKKSDEFLALLPIICQNLAELFPLKIANRISIVTTNIYEGDSASYDELYESLFTYKKISPFEWDNRVARKDVLNGENLNVISAIRRCEVISSVINYGNPADIIVSEVDTNTVASNTSPRFPIANVSAKLLELFQTNQDVRLELARYLS
jgi:hypothetical protein